jgi:hypothetical protein
MVVVVGRPWVLVTDLLPGRPFFLSICRFHGLNRSFTSGPGPGTARPESSSRSASSGAGATSAAAAEDELRLRQRGSAVAVWRESGDMCTLRRALELSLNAAMVRDCVGVSAMDQRGNWKMLDLKMLDRECWSFRCREIFWRPHGPAGPLR